MDTQDARRRSHHPGHRRASNVSFLEGTGAEIDQGVVVNDRMQTTVPHVYAAGDVAQGRDFSTGEWVVHALQPTATEHGRVAALNMAGQDVPYRGSLSMNVLDTVGLISQTFGLWQGVEGGETPRPSTRTASSIPACASTATSWSARSASAKGAPSVRIRGLIQTRRKLGAWKDKLLDHPELVTDAFVDLDRA